MFVTLTLNPTVDCTWAVEVGLALNQVHRVRAETRTPGGKGINVAKAIAGAGRSVWAGGLLGSDQLAFFEGVLRAAGVGTKIVVGSGVRNGLYLAVPPGSSIARLEDLKGKRVAVYKGTNLHLSAVRALAARGIKESDLRLINLDLPGAQAALTTRDIDAAFGYVELYTLRDKGVQVAKGAQVTLKGFCSGSGITGVSLTDCIVTH